MLLSSVWTWLGNVAYGPTLELQERIRESVIAGNHPETLLLVEHPPVITLGRSAVPEHILVDQATLSHSGIDVVQTKRGGDVTYHGPGQLVGYPIFRVSKGIRQHMLAMAEGLTHLLHGLGVAAEWRRDCPGLWVGPAKLCAFGVHVRKRVAIHGFALNVSTDLASFKQIIPCGLRAAEVTSIQALTGRFLPLAELASQVPLAFEKSFGRDFQSMAAVTLRLQSENVSH
jgi:lipoyl(octanoyl) transferase